jgi:hypothetical protein
MIDWKLYLYYASIRKAELINIKSAKLSFERNTFLNGSFEYNANNIDPIIQEFLIDGAEIRVYRRGYDENEYRLIAAGEIQDLSLAISNNNTKTYRGKIVPWALVFLPKRFITANFVGQEEADIAWNIINSVQTDTYSGTYTLNQIDMGITQGILNNTGNIRDRKYTNQPALTMLQQLSNVKDIGGNPQRLRGFRISPDLIDDDYLKFRYFAEYGTERDITYTNNSIDSVNVTSQTSKTSNRVEANGADGTTPQYATDTTNMDFWKLRTSQISKTNIETDATLLESAEEELSVRILPEKLYKIGIANNDPFTGKYRVGDLIYIRYNDKDKDGNRTGLLDIDEQLRVYKIDLSFNEKSIEKTSIVVAKERPISVNTNTTDKLVSKLNDTELRLTNIEK